MQADASLMQGRYGPCILFGKALTRFFLSSIPLVNLSTIPSFLTKPPRKRCGRRKEKKRRGKKIRNKSFHSSATQRPAKKKNPPTKHLQDEKLRPPNMDPWLWFPWPIVALAQSMLIYSTQTFSSLVVATFPPSLSLRVLQRDFQMSCLRPIYLLLSTEYSRTGFFS